MWHNDPSVFYIKSKAGSYTDENIKMLKWQTGYAENEAWSSCPLNWKSSINTEQLKQTVHY